MKNRSVSGIVFALLAATLYALCSPFSKMLMEHIEPKYMAAFLYLGTGAGMFIIRSVKKITNRINEAQLAKKDFCWFLFIIPLGIFSTLMLTFGINNTTAANASLLNNFEIVATAVIAFFIFHEQITKRLWLAITLITIASFLLSFNGESSLKFSSGSLFVILSCIGWGFENNCTRQLSGKDPLEIVMIKGLCSGSLTLVYAFISKEKIPEWYYIITALILGFVSFGISNFFYIFAQRKMGAAKTSAFYAVSPFIGTAVSFLIFKQIPGLTFIIALIIMLSGAYFAASDFKYNG